jgi:hypothetical protein
MEKYPHIDLNEELNFFISRLEGIEWNQDGFTLKKEIYLNPIYKKSQ